MAAGRVLRSIGVKLPVAFAAALLLVAIGCSASSPPESTQGAEWQRSTAEIHDIPVTGENIGVEVGKHVPPFALGLADGSTITSQELLEASQPTFLFFWATT